MAQDNIIKRSLEAGINLSNVTKERAKELGEELIKEGTLSKESIEKALGELLEWSRKNYENVASFVREEVSKQVKSLKLVNQNELNQVVAKLKASLGRSPSAPKAQSAKQAVRKSTTKGAKKSSAKKAAAKKSK